MKSATFRYRGGAIRVAPRGGEGLASFVVHGDAPPDQQPLERAIAAARRRGYREVVTSAVRPRVGLSLVDAGFGVRERLHLLSHDLRSIPRAEHKTRRYRPGDLPSLMAVDRLAFDDHWRFDEGGLREAAAATPVRRIRVAGPRGRVIAYAIFGRSGREGFVQRLAVHADERRRGWGRSLLADGLSWLRRRGAARATVNTQEGNQAALDLYEAAGFRRLPSGLWVMGRSL